MSKRIGQPTACKYNQRLADGDYVCMNERFTSLDCGIKRPEDCIYFTETDKHLDWLNEQIEDCKTTAERARNWAEHDKQRAIDAERVLEIYQEAKAQYLAWKETQQ